MAMYKDKTSQSNDGNVVSGLAFLMDSQRFNQAPAAFERLLGFRLEQVSKGQVRLVAEATAECINPMNTLHGGYIAALLDAAMSASAHSLLEAGKTFTTIEIKINFMKAVHRPFNAIYAQGAVRRSGSRVAFVEGYRPNS